MNGRSKLLVRFLYPILFFLLLVFSPQDSNGSVLDRFFDALGLKRTSLEEKTYTKLQHFLLNDESEEAVTTLLRYHDIKLKEYQKGDIPHHTRPIIFYQTHWHQMLISLYSNVDEHQIKTACDIVGNLFFVERDHFFITGNTFGNLGRKLTLLAEKRDPPSNVLDEFLKLHGRLTPKGKIVAELAIACWINHTGGFWFEKEWAQARQWLETNGAVEKGFQNAVRLGLAGREMHACEFREFTPSQKLIDQFEKALQPYLNDPGMPDPFRLGLLRNLLEHTKSGIHSPFAFDTYIQLIESEEQRGIPPFASEWAILAIATMTQQPNAAQLEKISNALAISFERNKTPGVLHQKVHPAIKAYRHYLQIFQNGSIEKGQEFARSFAFEDQDGFSYDLLLIYLQLGAFDLVEEALPKMSMDANVHLISSHPRRRSYLPASEGLFEQLDTYHSRYKDEIDSLKLELALRKLCLNPEGKLYGLGQGPLDKRVQNLYPKFRALHDKVSDRERAAILSLLDPTMIPSREEMEGWHGWQVYQTMPEGAESIHARGALMVMAYQYGDREFWEQFIPLIPDLTNFELETFSQYLLRSFLSDVLLNRKESTARKAEFLQAYLKEELKNSHQSLNLNQKYLIPVVSIASQIGGVPFHKKEFSGSLSPGGQTDFNRLLQPASSLNSLLHYARLHTKFFEDRTTQDDFYFRLSNYLIGDPVLSKKGLFSSSDSFSLSPSYVPSEKIINQMEAQQLDPGALLVAVINEAKRTRNNRRLADKNIEALQLAQRAVADDKRYRHHCLAAQLIAAEILLKQNKVEAAKKLVSEVKSENVKASSAWIAKLDKFMEK